MEGLSGVKTVSTKKDWHALYSCRHPRLYYAAMNETDYGQYQDRFVEFIVPALDEAFGREPDRCVHVVEFGALFGNTTLAYRNGLDWKQTYELVWQHSDDDQKPHTVPALRNMHVTGVDLAASALQYGLERGVFDEIVVQDFNGPLSADLIGRLERCDFLALVMVSSYIKTEALLRICDIFLRDRTKTKVYVFNDVCAYVDRNVTPEVIFHDYKNWTSKTFFNKSRDFTEEESALRHGCKEAWTYTWVVTFAPCPE